MSSLKRNRETETDSNSSKQVKKSTRVQSCSACRRAKSKCDVKLRVPCSGCSLKGTEEACIAENGEALSIAGSRTNHYDVYIQTIRNSLTQLEGALRSATHQTDAAPVRETEGPATNFTSHFADMESVDKALALDEGDIFPLSTSLATSAADAEKFEGFENVGQPFIADQTSAHVDQEIASYPALLGAICINPALANTKPDVAQVIDKFLPSYEAGLYLQGFYKKMYLSGGLNIEGAVPFNGSFPPSWKGMNDRHALLTNKGLLLPKVLMMYASSIRSIPSVTDEDNTVVASLCRSFSSHLNLPVTSMQLANHFYSLAMILSNQMPSGSSNRSVPCARVAFASTLDRVDLTLMIMQYYVLRRSNKHDIWHMCNDMRGHILALGLNRDPLKLASNFSKDVAMERRLRLWSFITCDAWCSFYFGRASAFPPHMYDVPPPSQDPQSPEFLPQLYHAFVICQEISHIVHEALSFPPKILETMDIRASAVTRVFSSMMQQINISPHNIAQTLATGAKEQRAKALLQFSHYLGHFHILFLIHSLPLAPFPTMLLRAERDPIVKKNLTLVIHYMNEFMDNLEVVFNSMYNQPGTKGAMNYMKKIENLKWVPDQLFHFYVFISIVLNSMPTSHLFQNTSVSPYHLLRTRVLRAFEFLEIITPVVNDYSVFTTATTSTNNDPESTASDSTPSSFQANVTTPPENCTVQPWSHPQFLHEFDSILAFSTGVFDLASALPDQQLVYNEEAGGSSAYGVGDWNGSEKLDQWLLGEISFDEFMANGEFEV